jgi:hypothetical protein
MKDLSVGNYDALMVELHDFLVKHNLLDLVESIKSKRVAVMSLKNIKRGIKREIR